MNINLHEVPFLERLRLGGKTVRLVERAAHCIQAEEAHVALLDVAVATAGETDQAAVVADQPLQRTVECDVAVVAVEGLLVAWIDDPTAADYTTLVVDVLWE